MSIKMLYEKDGTTPMSSALNVGYPQTTGTSLTSGATFTAPSNGWVKCYGGVRANGVVRIHVNNVNCFNFVGDSSTTYLWCEGGCHVRKDDVINSTFPTGGGGNLLPRPRDINSTHMGFARVFTGVNRGR